MQIIPDSYRNITANCFKYISIICSCSFINPCDNYAICKACPFIFAVLYTQVSTVAPPTDSRHGRSNGLHDTYATMLGGSRDMLSWKIKVNKKVFVGSDYWTASASRRYFKKKKKPNKLKDDLYSIIYFRYI